MSRGVNAALTSEDRQSAVLVLTDGTVLETSLRAQGGGYSVEVAGGGSSLSHRECDFWQTIVWMRGVRCEPRFRS